MGVALADGRDSRMLRLDSWPPLGLSEQRSPFPAARAWKASMHRNQFITVLASVDGGSLHLSISHSHRYPTWDEIRAVRDWAFPEETEVVMVLARKSEYVNLHPNCFHLWESACGKEGR